MASDKKYTLTDHQRRWLSSLANQDYMGWSKTVLRVLETGYYGDIEKPILNHLTNRYKVTHDTR